MRSTKTRLKHVTAASLLACALLSTDAAKGADPQPQRGAMVLVPAGTFVMGADGVGEEDERPAHTVELDAYYIDKFEVTNAQYRACVAAKKCKEPKKVGGKSFREADRPVVGVSWFDARDYCAFAGKRLLTEAEWEKAARGPDGQTYPWGQAAPGLKHGCFAWHEPRPCKPGSYPAGDSPYGVSDMAGGVWEWLGDHYDAGYYPRSPKKNPKGGTCAESKAFFKKLRQEGRQGFTGSNPIPTECEYVLRGGAWNYPAAGLRSSNRVHHGPDFRIKVAGIRCGADADGAR
jgi:formylglycine-generating enzyme required for sulfatase activity